MRLDEKLICFSRLKERSIILKLTCLLEKFLLKSPISAKVCVMNLSLVIEPSASLNSQDSPCQTYGCRHGTPYNCSKNSMENVCAFVTADIICSKPPAGWARQYEKLLKIV